MSLLVGSPSDGDSLGDVPPLTFFALLGDPLGFWEEHGELDRSVSHLLGNVSEDIRFSLRDS